MTEVDRQAIRETNRKARQRAVEAVLRAQLSVTLAAELRAEHQRLKEEAQLVVGLRRETITGQGSPVS